MSRSIPSPHSPCAARIYPLGARLPFLEVKGAAWVLGGVFHVQSPDLTIGEVLLGGALAAVCSWGILSTLVSSRPLAPPVKWGVLLLCWYLLNTVIAAANQLDPVLWLRFAFPAFLFPSSFFLGWTLFRSPTARRRIVVWIGVVGAIAVVASFVEIRGIAAGDVTNLQLLRVFGGDYYAPLAMTLALPFLATAEGRRVVPWPLSLTVVVIGSTGLAVSFTRTYWLSTTFSTLLLVLLLARHRPRDLMRLALGVPLALAIAAVIVVPRIPPNVFSLLLERLSGLSQIGEITSLTYRVREVLGLLATQAKDPTSFLVGSGFGAPYLFEYVHPQTGVLYGGLEKGYVHNYYAFLLLDVGIVGLALFAALWISSLRQMLHDLQRARTRVSSSFPVQLSVVTISVNLLVASVATPQLLNFQFPVIFGFLIAAGVGTVPVGRIRYSV